MVKIPVNISIDEVHLPISKWTKERILDQIGGQYRQMWSNWTKEDLINTVMVHDGYQWGGDYKGYSGGYCQLYCLNRSIVDKIEETWGDME